MCHFAMEVNAGTPNGDQLQSEMAVSAYGRTSYTLTYVATWYVIHEMKLDKLIVISLRVKKYSGQSKKGKLGANSELFYF